MGEELLTVYTHTGYGNSLALTDTQARGPANLSYERSSIFDPAFSSALTVRSTFFVGIGTASSHRPRSPFRSPSRPIVHLVQKDEVSRPRRCESIIGGASFESFPNPHNSLTPLITIDPKIAFCFPHRPSDHHAEEGPQAQGT